jgi:cell division initiation protein
VRITPLDIRQQQFTVRMFRGFDVQEVDTFLEDLAADYETLLKENALLKEQLQALEERTRGLEDRERALQETLVTTQKVMEEMKESARRETSLMVREAELKGEKIVEAARMTEASIRAEIIGLKRTRRQFAQSLRSTVEMYQRLLEQDLRTEGDVNTEGHDGDKE